MATRGWLDLSPLGHWGGSWPPPVAKSIFFFWFTEKVVRGWWRRMFAGGGGGWRRLGSWSFIWLLDWVFYYHFKSVHFS
jgi:hypothetical protein